MYGRHDVRHVGSLVALRSHWRRRYDVAKNPSKNLHQQHKNNQFATKKATYLRPICDVAATSQMPAG